MVTLTSKKATDEQIKKISKHFQGYIKIVVDIEQGVLAAGADRHYDEEQALLEKGSKQKNLWGGGVDLETKEIDYNSIINLRPLQGNPSRDIMSQDVRDKFDGIVKKLIF